MVKTIEEEEAEKSLKKPNKGNTAAKSSTIVQPVMELHGDEAKTSQKKVTLVVQRHESYDHHVHKWHKTKNRKFTKVKLW